MKFAFSINKSALCKLEQNHTLHAGGYFATAVIINTMLILMTWKKIAI